MTAIFHHPLSVDADAIDENGHASNVAFLSWMQDAAVAHSAERGWRHERYAELGATWVARSHHIEYLRPAYKDDRLVVLTWIADFQRVKSRRKYEIYRLPDARLLARAETQWVFVDMERGRPSAVPAELEQSFVIAGEDPVRSPVPSLAPTTRLT